MTARRVARIPYQPRAVQDPGSFDPREFAPDFDVIHELRANYPVYAEADAWLTMTDFPDAVRTALDKIQARCFQVGAKPALAGVICACLAHGLEALYEHPDVVALGEVKDDFNKSDLEDAEAEEVLAGWLRVARMEVSIPGGSRRRQNVRIPDALKGELFHLAAELGVTASSLGVLAIMLTLSTQEAVHPDQRERMAGAVAAFIRRIHWRAAGTRALMGVLL